MPTILVLKPVYKDSSATCVLFLFLLCYTVCPKGPIASTSFLSFYNASLTINKKKKKIRAPWHPWFRVGWCRRVPANPNADFCLHHLAESLALLPTLQSIWSTVRLLFCVQIFMRQSVNSMISIYSNCRGLQIHIQ